LPALYRLGSQSDAAARLWQGLPVPHAPTAKDQGAATDRTLGSSPAMLTPRAATFRTASRHDTNDLAHAFDVTSCVTAG
jgi:hypothetical protein